MFARLSSALAGACLLLATPAVAQDNPATLSVNVADLNVATADGRAKLDRRIRKAASEICDMGSVGLPMQIAYTTCRNKVLASADQQVAQLAQLKSGRIELARNVR